MEPNTKSILYSVQCCYIYMHAVHWSDWTDNNKLLYRIPRIRDDRPISIGLAL